MKGCYLCVKNCKFHALPPVMVIICLLKNYIYIMCTYVFPFLETPTLTLLIHE